MTALAKFMTDNPSAASSMTLPLPPEIPNIEAFLLNVAIIYIVIIAIIVINFSIIVNILAMVITDIIVFKSNICFLPSVLFVFSSLFFYFIDLRDLSNYYC